MDAPARIVLPAPIPHDADVLGAIDAVAADPDVEIALLLFPRMDVARGRMHRWVEHLRKAHATRCGGTPVLALEGFHPHAEADATSPERLTPFVRRTPDPTIQLTRLSVLDRVRRGTPQGTAFFDPSSMDLEALLNEDARPPLHERIAERNHATVLELGAAHVTQVMNDILRDRDESYRNIDPDIARRG